MRSRLRKLLNLVGLTPAPSARTQAEDDGAAELRRRLDQTRQRLKREIPTPD